jgi:amino acid transporter
MGGWGVAVAGMVVLANLAQVASVYFWDLFGLDLANNDWRIILVAVIFIAAMTWVSWRGVEIGERIQNILLAVQYIALAIFVVAALWQFFAGTAPNPTPFDWNWMNPSRSRTSTASPRRCCWRSSSTGAGTRASPSTRRRRTRSASPAARLCSPPSSCCSPTSPSRSPP